MYAWFLKIDPVHIISIRVEMHIISIRVETGSGHPGYRGQQGHILSGSSGSDPVYKISGCDPDFALDHVH